MTAIPAHEPGTDGSPPVFLAHDRLADLHAVLAEGGRTVIGPRLVDGAIALAPIESASELSTGLAVSSAPGRIRLIKRAASDPRGARIFDHGPALGGIKPWTFPSRVDALHLEKTPSGDLSVRVEAPAPAPIAVLGARACDLAGLAIHDRVLAGGPVVDPDYAARRADLFIVAVECAVAQSTCFCTSMGTGPEVGHGADLIMGELDDGFVVSAGTGAGEHCLASLGLEPANDVQVASAATQLSTTRASISGGVAADGLRDRLMANLDHPRWDAVAERCVGCANCTLVCPTCFCTGLALESDLDGRTSTAQRTWDSCFTEGFAQVAGGSFRPRHRDRYRQWLTHKFATWWDQFGSSGCVGCGRCIVWCPVGIDVREELAAIAAPPPGGTIASVPPPIAPEAEPGVEPGPEPRAGRRHAESAIVPSGYDPARVVAVHQETADTSTLRLRTDGAALPAGGPGQFVMVAVPAFAIPPISISRYHPDGIELTIRAAGAATTFLTRLGVGSTVGLRGPLGRPWPVADAYGRDVVIVAGGIGLAPIRALLDAILAERERFGAVRLYVGARTPRDRLFVPEIDALAARDDVLVRVTVDRAGPEWLGRVGVVTQLFRTVTGTGHNVTAFVCGPERMMQATADRLLDLGVAAEHTWLTMERHMGCGVGLCGHCQFGGRFVCADGPVFSVAELGDDLRTEGL